MSTRAALITGTVASLAVTAAWSYSSTLTTVSAAPLHLTTDLPADYMQVGTAATGSTWVALLAVTAAIYAACLFTSGLRAHRKAQRNASRALDRTEDVEAVAVSGRVLAMPLTRTAPWHSFTISGAAHWVRMVRQYEGQQGSVWRDYQNMSGRVICVRAKGPDAKRVAAEKATARVAANRFAGNR